jgi:hypothetical protein
MILGRRYPAINCRATLVRPRWGLQNAALPPARRRFGATSRADFKKWGVEGVLPKSD